MKDPKWDIFWSTTDIFINKIPNLKLQNYLIIWPKIQGSQYEQVIQIKSVKHVFKLFHDEIVYKFNYNASYAITLL